MSHKCEKKGGHDWGWLGLFLFWGELQSSNFLMEFGIGGKMDPKGVLVSQAMAEHYGRRKEKGTTISHVMAQKS